MYKKNTINFTLSQTVVKKKKIFTLHIPIYYVISNLWASVPEKIVTTIVRRYNIRRYDPFVYIVVRWTILVFNQYHRNQTIPDYFCFEIILQINYRCQSNCNTSFNRCASKTLYKTVLYRSLGRFFFLYIFVKGVSLVRLFVR